MSNNRYGGVIWTNHALERLGQRGLSQHMALETFKSPDKKMAGKKSGSIELQKKFNTSTVTVIAAQSEKKEWLILSCWIDPPYYGTRDWKDRQYYREYQKAGFWGKLWIIFKKQVGI